MTFSTYEYIRNVSEPNTVYTMLDNISFIERSSFYRQPAPVDKSSITPMHTILNKIL